LGVKSGTDNTDLSSGFIQTTDPSGDVWSTYYNYLDILKTTPNIVTAVEDVVQSVIPTSYSLAQNYPNPFNPSTTIAFELPKQEYISLKVNYVIGQEVSALVNEVRPAGRYSEGWAGLNISSGVYFYTLHSQSFSQIKKMIMLK
jgi:hypothetical protein